MSKINEHCARRRITARIALVILVGGCASANTSKVRIETHPNRDVLGYERVLIAGFLPDGFPRIDLNQETARFLRTQLRAKTSLVIIESEPVQLAGTSSPSGGGSVQPVRNDMATSTQARPQDFPESQQDNTLFTNVSFWKTLGEEYSEPLIVTGIVRFTPAGPRMEERQMGRRTLRLWFPGFSLRLRLILISGKTGEIVNSVPLRQLTAHARTGRESALSIYLRLMEQTMPSVLAVLGQQTTQTRELLK